MIALATRTADNLEEAVHLREDLLGSLELLRLAGRYCPCHLSLQAHCMEVKAAPFVSGAST